MLGNSGSSALSPAQKWVGGGLIGLLLIGLLVAFATTPMTAPDGSARASTTLNADTGADTSVATAAFATQPELSAGADSGSGSGKKHSATVVRPTTYAAAPSAVMPNVQFSGATPVSVIEADAEMLKADVTIRDADKDQLVRMAVGQKLAIRLKENRTTGYVWKIESDLKQGGDALPKHFLSLLHDKFYKGVGRTASGRPLVGAPGEHVWVLRALSEGKWRMCIGLRRPWEPLKQTPPAQLYCFPIEVTAAPAAADTN